MLLKDTFAVEASLESVWAFLEDIPRVSACVPGAEEVAEVAPNVYRGLLKAKIGPLAVSFGGQVTIIERVPRERLAATIEGDEKSLASFVNARFVGYLAQGESGTHLTYEVDMALRGRLAQFGFSVFQGTAKKMTAEFARRLQEALTQSNQGATES